MEFAGAGCWGGSESPRSQGRENRNHHMAAFQTRVPMIRISMYLDLFIWGGKLHCRDPSYDERVFLDLGLLGSLASGLLVLHQVSLPWRFPVPEAGA